MEMNITNIIDIIGMVNSFLMGLVFMGLKRGNRNGNTILAALFILWSYGFFYSLYISQKWFLQFPHLIQVGAPFSFTFGPLLYLYIKTQTYRKRRFRKVMLLHFIPFIAHTLYLIPFYLQDDMLKLRTLHTKAGYDSAFYVIVYMQLLHIAVYLILSIAEIIKHKRNISNNFSYRDQISLSWLIHIIASAVIIFLIFATILTYFSLIEQKPKYINSSTDIAFIIIIHILAYRGFNQVNIFRDEGMQDTKENPPVINDEIARDFSRKIINEMENSKLYLNGTLTLRDLSEATHISPHKISYVLNNTMKINFFEFVNRYRVEEAKKQIKTITSTRKSMLEIAYDVGFNSKSSFNSVFKEYCSMTPTEYRRSDESV